jgi:hypothetical protein
MEPAPPPLRPGSALGLYLRALGRGLVGLVARPADPLSAERVARAAAAARAGRGLSRAQSTCGALALLMGAVCLWVFAGDGVAFDVSGHEVSLRNLRNPSKLLVLFGASWFVLRDLRGGAWRAPRALERAGKLRATTRAGVLLWCALLWSLAPTLDRVGECLDVQAARAASGRGSTLFENEWHLHLRPLIAHVAARASEPQVALVIEDVNPRGHLPSFYAYPRLLRMQQELHAWTLAEMMTRGGEVDPGFVAPGSAPAREDVRRWAAQRGLELLVARPDGVEVLDLEDGR